MPCAEYRQSGTGELAAEVVCVLSDVEGANVSGNYITGTAREQLVIAGTFVALIGEDVMKGGAYYAQGAPWAKKQSDLLRFRSIDLDGNGTIDPDERVYVTTGADGNARSRRACPRRRWPRRPCWPAPRRWASRAAWPKTATSCTRP